MKKKRSGDYYLFMSLRLFFLVIAPAFFCGFAVAQGKWFSVIGLAIGSIFCGLALIIWPENNNDKEGSE